jgi:O-antigen/teichoic acid export membrane protein
LLGGLKAYYFDLAFQLGKRPARQLWITAISAAVVTSLNFWWIPQFGAVGAAWATVIAFAVGLLLSVVWGRSTFALPISWLALGKSVAATSVMAGLLWVLPPSLGLSGTIIKLLAGVVTFAAAAYLLDIAHVRTERHA